LINIFLSYNYLNHKIIKFKKPQKSSINPVLTAIAKVNGKN